ncbi:phospholipid-translocating P-type ATPase, flippase [Nitzschia inconspicua]|uniref:Phospholipid-translocating P-type ATPase, flippase n=1 Tax=Nitzschia inconspicua TaxID=303405 RepID=A0A9K3LYQ9_9STRA|nr:phospholipid-translocating P-type ATPase, flippase [Nitzschia inconspicua]
MEQFDEPFKGIIMAIEDLCSKILDEPTIESSGSIGSPEGSSTSMQQSGDGTEIKQLLVQNLQLELPFLVTFFPKLSSIVDSAFLGEKTSVNQSGRDSYSQTINVDSVAGVRDTIDIKANADRLKHCVRKFIQTICCASPLIIHLDDTQWADPESLDLLYQILIDTFNHDALMVVCSYRSNETTGGNHLKTNLTDKILEFSDKNPVWAVPIYTVTIDNLLVDKLNSFLQDLLSGDFNDNMELAHVLHDKTRGNIFFVNQLLVALHKQGFLEYSLGIGKWIWDIQKIRQEAPPADNVVELVKEKLLKDTKAMQLLAIAACLGSQFSRANLMLVVEGIRIKAMSSKRKFKNTLVLYSFLSLDFDTADLLHHCHREEYIQPTAANDGFHFFHDRIQEVALSVLPDKVVLVLKY